MYSLLFIPYRNSRRWWWMLAAAVIVIAAAVGIATFGPAL